VENKKRNTLTCVSLSTVEVRGVEPLTFPQPAGRSGHLRRGGKQKRNTLTCVSLSTVEVRGVEPLTFPLPAGRSGHLRRGGK